MKINLVRQNIYKYKRAEIIRRINSIVVITSLSLFGIVVLFVTANYIYYSIRGTQLRNDLQQMQSIYTSRAQEVVEYVRTKQVINNVSKIQSSRFHYKEFLAGIYDLMPITAKLSSVDFSQEGVITVGIRMKTLSDYDDFQARVQAGSQDTSFLFKEITQKNFNRDSSGAYLVQLEVTIK